MSSVTPSVKMTQEVTLKVISPRLNENNTTATINSQTCTSNSLWTVTLTRSNDKMLAMTLQWQRGTHQDFTHYQSVRVFPESCPTPILTYSFIISKINLVNGPQAKCGSFKEEDVIKDDEYNFEIVLCTAPDLPRKLELPTPPAPKNHDIIPLLLKDANSVDVCFTFTCDKVYSNVGLWAHSVVLARHKVFAKLFQHQDDLKSIVANNDDRKAAKVESDAESTSTISADSSPRSSLSAATGDTRSLVVKVDKFSLATFCALLYYIYTDEVHLAIDTDRFAISSGEGSLIWRDPTTGKMRDSVRWHPTDQSSPWKLKDVTWDELLEAADHYGISDLRANCLEKVISGMNQSNVVGTLFSKSVSGTEVQQAAMEFIVKHWGSIFQKGRDGGMDPFAAYRDHPECHEVLIELMQMKTASI
ncbi:hypothetical protein BGZ47_006555 [Haplosporangium gracile]|nr:hypothetical protein BGZ47_006555 [Haplosporangium gracile]